MVIYVIMVVAAAGALALAVRMMPSVRIEDMADGALPQPVAPGDP